MAGAGWASGRSMDLQSAFRAVLDRHQGRRIGVDRVRRNKYTGSGCCAGQRRSAGLGQLETGENGLRHVHSATVRVRRLLIRTKSSSLVKFRRNVLLQLTDSFQTSMTRFLGGRPRFRRNMLSRENEGDPVDDPMLSGVDPAAECGGLDAT